MKNNWAKYCQRKFAHNANVIKTSEQESENEYQIEDIYFRVATQNLKKMFVPEMNRSTIIDTTCNKTVAHEEWLQSYLEILDQVEMPQNNVTTHLNLVMGIKLLLCHKS